MKTIMFKLYTIISVIMNYQILFVSVIKGDLTCKDIEHISPTVRLRRHLFCDYDSGVRPAHHRDSTNVSLRLQPRLIEFDDRRNTLILHSNIQITWQDFHLTWNPDDFDGVIQIRAKSTDIWIPDLSVYNSGDMSAGQNVIPETDCLVENSGSIFCVPVVKYVSYCDADYRNWPFDRQNCTVRLGSWSQTGEKINFLFLSDKPVTLEEYTENQEWRLISVNATKIVQTFKCCPNDTFPSLFFHFILERHVSVMAAIYISPAIWIIAILVAYGAIIYVITVLIAITLTILCLDPKSTERMIVAGINFICHLLCIQEIHWLLPFNGANAPNILFFYRDSLILSGLSIFLTAFLRQLQVISMPAPGWLSTSIAFMIKSRAGQIFLFNTLNPKASQKVEADARNSDLMRVVDEETTWVYFAAFIGRLSFIGVFVTYIVMLLNLVPNS